MGIVADRLASTRIELSTPDGLVTGVLRSLDDVSFEFRDGSLRHYNERGLERQLSSLLARLCTDYRRARFAAVAEATGRPAEPFTPWRANGRRYEAEREETVAEGMSTGHRVFVSTTGLRRWNVVIRDGSLSSVDEVAFAAEVGSGYAAMVLDWRRKLRLLRAKHFPH